MPDIQTVDSLADLGLDLGPSDTGASDAAQSPTIDVAAVTAAVTKKRERVNIGELEFGTMDLIPVKRGGGGGAKESKYGFDKLAAPVATGDVAKPWTYATFLARLQEGVDAAALKRSVQSAVTAANAEGKAEGKRFITRSFVQDGEFVGIVVYRVDDTLDDAE